MQRRRFIMLLGTVAAVSPLTAWAQRGKIFRVGILANEKWRATECPNHGRVSLWWTGRSLLAMTGENPYVAIGVGMVKNARVTCQNNCRLMASATEWAVPGRMMNWRSPFGSLL